MNEEYNTNSIQSAISCAKNSYQNSYSTNAITAKVNYYNDTYITDGSNLRISSGYTSGGYVSSGGLTYIGDDTQWRNNIIKIDDCVTTITYPGAVRYDKVKNIFEVYFDNEWHEVGNYLDVKNTDSTEPSLKDFKNAYKFSAVDEYQKKRKYIITV